MDRTTLDADSRNWDHSHPLDVYIWSDYVEVNSFVDKIYCQYFDEGKSNIIIAKKHIKKVLLDLYVTWVDDPTMNIGVHMKEEAYSNGSAVDEGRYNVLNIKGSTIKVVKRLVDVGLIGFKKGHPALEGYDRGHVSRIWSSPKLIKMFETARFSEFNMGYTDSRLVLILNKTTKEKIDGKTKRRVKLIDYDPEKLPRKIKRMEQVIKGYNALLERTFIDIGDAETYRVLIPATKKRKDKNKKVYVNITHHSKFTHRVFNNGNWKQGGRFYGGWWQRVGSKIREKILIDNTPTVELDFSGLHPVLAYATKGLDYDTKNNYPYDIPIPKIDASRLNNLDTSKSIIKLLMLMALNAPDEKSLFQAFRGEFNKTAESQILKSFDFKITNELLKEILEDIKHKHSPIADMFATKAGLDLMYIDSQIVEYVIKKFTQMDVPVLQIYDSFRVRIGNETKLEETMEEAFQEITGRSYINTKLSDNLTLEQVNSNKHLDRDYHLEMLQVMTNPETCDGYKRRYERHLKHYKPVRSEKPFMNY